MPEELAEAVRARTGSGGFSRYVTDAVEERVRLNLLDELSEQLQAEFGPFDEEGVRQAMRLWTEEERYRSLVLDAEGLVKLATGDPKATLPFEAARRLKGHVVTSATTLIEVLRGDRSDARIYRVLSHVTVIPIDLNRARAAGELLGRTGLDVHRCALDALVATIALAQPGRVVVLTSDADDMAKLTQDPARSRKDRVCIVRV
jgi:predicted nucleic acid-binding protein